jgi:uncharacterized protein YgbK (DUF1537 family)
VLLDPRRRSDAQVVAVDLATRARPERAARSIARRAFGSRAAKRARILYKKIDSTLKGHVAAELAAIRWRGSLVFAPAFPAQGRTTVDGRLRLNGKPASGDLRAPLSRAGLPATHIDLASLRAPHPEKAFERAVRTGARGLVCDAVTDADLDRIARAGMALRPRPLFVGSGGLARAIARTFARKRGAPRPVVPCRPVVAVVGSASPVSVGQARHLGRSRSLGNSGVLVQMAWTRAPGRRDIAAVRRLGRLVARAAPDVHYVLTGGETARAVLKARGIRELRLLGEVEPGVPFGMARDGTLVCTKAGAFGRPDTLARCAARLNQEMKRA